MADKIMLNNEVYNVVEQDLPCLITYTDKTGGSHFSVTMVVDLFLQGKKILFLTAYPMAKDNFLTQIKGQETKTCYVTDVNQLDYTKQVIILESGNEPLFLQSIRILPDIDERIILIKNIEVFGQAVFDACSNHQQLILSGDIDKCIAGQQLSQKLFNTIVAFTKPTLNLNIKIPPLEKYTAYWSSQHKKDLAKIQFGTK